jgi:gliding motility-associated-like protein
VIIHETPATPTLTTNAPICNGNTLELNSTTTFTGALSYTWTGPGGFTAGTANTSIPNAQTINSGTYSLQITSVIGSCNATPATIPATVFETPVITSTAFTHPTQCNTPTGSITIFGMQANTTYTVSYEYNTAPQSIMLTSNNTGSILISNLPAGVYSLITVSVNGCTSAPAPSVALMDPNPPAPPTLSYNGPVCTNETIQLNAATSQPGTATFNWNGPAGFIGTQSAHQIINATDLNAGTYYATVTIDNCTSNPAQLLVVVHPLPDAPVAASPVQYCINTTATALTATPATGNTLNWYLSTNRQNPVATAPVPNTATIGSTTFYVTQTNTHVCEGPETPVVVQINPDAEAVFNPTATEGCPPFDIDHSIIGLQQFPDNNDAYNWYANNVFIGTGTTFPGYTIAQQNDSITIKLVTTSPFGCLSDSTEHKFFTYKVPQPAFAADVYEGCGPLSVNFSNNTPDQNLYTYHWDFDNGITSTLAQPGNVVFQPNPLSGDTVYNVRLQVTSFCEVITVTHPITVKSKPIALFSPSRTVGCSPMQVTFVNTTRGNNITYHWDFGDGQVFNTTNNSNVQHTYYTGVADTFTVRLIATNECGADTTQFELIAAPNNINLNFQMNGPDQFGCAPHTVPFINNTPGASVFNWDFGDGNVLSTTASSDTVYHTYVSPGTYTITLHAENACTDTSATRTITVFPKPAASFNADRYTVCIGESVQLNNTSDAANSYLWNFGDGHTSTLVHPTHSYTAAGSYTVQLIIYRLNAPGNVCTDTTEQTIQVVSGLPGSFTVDRNGSCVPMTVTFVNEQAPSQLSTWDFGDGQSASGDSVVHTYMNPGNYTVQLTAMSPGGCNYSSTQTIQVTGVSGTLNYSGGYVCHPNSVRLEVSGTNIHEIEWNFGDGQTVTNNQQVMHHVYANPGNYLPSATLYSSNGCTFFLQGNDTIKVDKLDAGFAYTQHRYCGYTTINFEDTSSVFFGIQQIEWNFGDGNTATGSMVSHNYTASGNYQVTMVITGNSGCTETVVHTVPVTVNQIPSASIHAVSEGCTGETIRFQSVLQSIDAVTITQWNISNGVTGTGDRFEYVFTQAGNYTVRLIAGTDAGCFDTAVHIIEIRPAPHVTASGDVTYCLGSDAQLNVTGAITYQWTPGNALSCTDCANPVTSTTTTTPYVVTGTAANGCTSTDTVVVTVIHPLNMDVSANDSICIGMSAQLNASGAASYIWTPSNTLNNNRIPNPVATPTTTTTYRVIGYDGHNCFTDTAFVVVGVGQYPTVDLGPDLNLSAGTNHPLTSVVTNGPIAIWEWSPPNDLDCADCPQPIAYIRDNVTYTVRVVTPYGCDATDDVHIKVFCTDGQVYIPNAFTPDGDGINDILMVRGTGIARVKTFRIFNRWGEVVFERSNFQPNNPAYGWDGKVRGKVAGPDVFVYTAEVICENGTPYTYKGNVSIIK